MTHDGMLARTGLLLVLVGLMACGGRHRLADYDFAGRSMAVAYFGAPAPELRTGGYGVSTGTAVEAVVTAGARVARELEARRARVRLDSAAHRVDMAARIADRALERTSRYLGARPVSDRSQATYLLEVDIHTVGLEARSERVHLFVSGEAILLDIRTGREIWDADFRGYDPLTPDLVDDPMLESVLSVGALGMLSVEDFETVLGRLSDYAADRVARELRDDLRSVRRR